MASSSAACTPCLRALQRTWSTARTAPPSLLRRAYRTAPATQQSLFLDFLAPSTLRAVPRVRPVHHVFHSHRHQTTVAATPHLDAAPEHAAPASKHLARALVNPRKDESGKPMLISVSPRALHRLHTISSTDANTDLALRVTIESGGCHGFQYLMSLDDLSKSPATEDETVFERREGEKVGKVVIDEASLELLNGSTVDYTMELIGSQFKVTGIPGATSSCGCGTSFDIKM